MKRLPIIMLLCLVASVVLSSCLNTSDDIDKDWRDANISYYQAQQNLKNSDGTNYYQLVSASWDPSAQVLMHWYNNQELTKGNLSPLYTSTVDVKYHVQFYNGEALDSSYKSTSPADSIYRVRLSDDLIDAWPIAISKMHIGDSCRIVVPYNVGYGTYDYSNVKAYSTLIFELKLVGIPAYESKNTND